MENGFDLQAFLPFRLNVLAQEVSSRLSTIYAERFGLDIPQWRIIANLASRGEATAQVIARLTQSHKSTISRAVSELEGRGLIARRIVDDDKRSLTLRLTAKGKRLFRQVKPLVLQYEQELLRGLPPAERGALLRGLAALEERLAKQRGPS